jgi:hypothetical protein
VCVCVCVCVCARVVYVCVYLIVIKKPPRGGLCPSCAVATQREECNACPVHRTVKELCHAVVVV